MRSRSATPPLLPPPDPALGKDERVTQLINTGLSPASSSRGLGQQSLGFRERRPRGRDQPAHTGIERLAQRGAAHRLDLLFRQKHGIGRPAGQRAEVDKPLTGQVKPLAEVPKGELLAVTPLHRTVEQRIDLASRPTRGLPHLRGLHIEQLPRPGVGDQHPRCSQA